MNPWTWVGVDEPGSRVEGGEPVLCNYAWYATCETFLHLGSKMNPWTWVGVDEPGSRVKGGEPILCDYGPE
jgi:hypothetical protein